VSVFVSAVTVFFTGLFQYISWTNEVRLREATDVAAKAMSASEKIAAAINQRRYATLTLIDPLRELVLENSNELARRDAMAELASLGATTGSPPAASPGQHSPGQHSKLAAYEEERGKDRFDAYYERLTEWNEKVGQFATDLDYALDRPIFVLAYGAAPGGHEGINDYYNALEKIDCLSSLPKELEKKGLDSRRLKLRLAGIHYCFMQLNGLLGAKKYGMNGLSWDDPFHDKLKERLNYIDHMGNELRCYALHRVDYYNSLKAKAIISPGSIWTRLFGGQKERAEEQFEKAAAYCDSELKRAAARARTVASAR